MNDEKRSFGGRQSGQGENSQSQEFPSGLPPKGEGCSFTADLIQYAVEKVDAEGPLGEMVSAHVRKCTSCNARVAGLQKAARQLLDEKVVPAGSMLDDFAYGQGKELTILQKMRLWVRERSMWCVPTGVAPAAVIIAIVAIVFFAGVVVGRYRRTASGETEIARFAGTGVPLLPGSSIQGWRSVGGDSVVFEPGVRKELVERYEFRGKSFQDGWVFVLVRPIGEGALWRVQNSGEALRVRRESSFMIPCEFSADAKEFEVVAAVVSAPEDWPYSAGQTLITDIPRTADKIGPQRVTVTRGGQIPGEPVLAKEGLIAEILGPKGGDRVSREPDFIGRLTTKDAGWPVVLARPLIGSEPWYVQREVEKVGENGRFGTPVYLGDGSTPPNTSFRVVVVVCSSREEASSRFRTGMTLRSLPADLPMSDAITVVRQ